MTTRSLQASNVFVSREPVVLQAIYLAQTGVLEAISTSNIPFQTGGDEAWYLQSNVTHLDGTDAARSGVVSVGQTTWIECTVSGPALLSYWHKVNSMSPLTVSINNKLIAESSSIDWQQMMLEIPSGSHVVRWAYTRGQFDSFLNAVSYLDEVILGDKLLFDDNKLSPDELTFERGGNAQWFLQALTTRDGESLAARSGFIEVGQSSWMKTTLEGPGMLSYWRFTFTNDGDRFSVWKDAEIIEELEGEIWPYQVEHYLPSGEHEIRWEYTRGNPTPYGMNAVFVDSIAFTPEEPFNHSALSPAGLIFSHGGDTPWRITSDTVHPSGAAAVCKNLQGRQSAWLETTIEGPAVLSYWRKLDSVSPFAYLGVYLDDSLVERMSGAGITGLHRDWAKSLVSIPAGTHTLRWEHHADRTPYSETKAYVANVQLETELQFHGEAISSTGITFLNDENNPWRLQFESLMPGRTVAAQSAPLASGQTSTLATTVTGPGTLSYWFKIHSDSIYNYLLVSLDDTPATSYQDTIDWTKREIYIPTGEHTYQWQFERNAQTLAASEGAFLDQVNFTPDEPIDSRELTDSGLQFVSGGDAPWQLQEDIVLFAQDRAARSGALDKYQTSWIQTEITGAGTLRFWHQLDQQANDMNYRVYLNGEPQLTFDDPFAWQEASLIIPEGDHTIRWELATGYVGYEFKNFTYIDAVSFTTTDSLDDFYLLEDATSMGNNWYWNPWFGFFYCDQRDWIFHIDYRWVYTNTEGNTSANAWLYIVAQEEWFWVSNLLAPGIAYGSSRGSFVFWDPETAQWWSF